MVLFLLLLIVAVALGVIGALGRDPLYLLNIGGHRRPCFLRTRKATRPALLRVVPGRLLMHCPTSLTCHLPARGRALAVSVKEGARQAACCVGKW